MKLSVYELIKDDEHVVFEPEGDTMIIKSYEDG